MHYTIIGSALSGNLGATSMLEAAIQSISERDPDAEFVLFSMYPEEDQQLNRFSTLTVVPTKPFFLGGVLCPLTFLYRFVPLLRPLLRKLRHVGILERSDIFLDQGGITFTDGRELFLLYNVASLLPALFLRVPVIKCSQAIGPFRNALNRIVARMILPKMHTIFARGDETYRFLNGLGLQNVKIVPDYAFSLRVTPTEAAKTDKLLSGFDQSKDQKRIALFPSEVLYKRLKRLGTDYVSLMAEVVDGIAGQYSVVVYIVPHSQRFGTKGRHNNDRPVCLEIMNKTSTPNRIHLLDLPMNAQQMRHLIGSMDMVVTGRFHAMVSALSVGTPVLVTGWSHKYREVLSMFHVAGAVLDNELFSIQEIMEKFGIIFKIKKTNCSDTISSAERVRLWSLEQVETIIDVASNRNL